MWLYCRGKSILINRTLNFCTLQEEEAAAQGVQEKNDSSEVGWEDSEFQPFEDVQPIEQPGISDFFSNRSHIFFLYYIQLIYICLNENVFRITGVPSGNNKFEEAKRKREERKLARQRQMEAKRAVKLRTNPAAKKI